MLPASERRRAQLMEGGGGWLEWLDDEPGFELSEGAGFFSFIITATIIMNLCIQWSAKVICAASTPSGMARKCPLPGQ